MQVCKKKDCVQTRHANKRPKAALLCYVILNARSRHHWLNQPELLILISISTHQQQEVCKCKAWGWGVVYKLDEPWPPCAAPVQI